MRRTILFMAAVIGLGTTQASGQAGRDIPAKPSVQAQAQAQKDAPTPPAPPPVSSSPERTTASYGDWILRCDAASGSAKRVCEVGQQMTVQGQTAPVAQIAFGRASRSEPMRVTVVLPNNVSLLSQPRLLSAKDEKSPVELSWQRCIPGGCIASAVASDELAGRVGAKTEPGSIVFKDAAEREVAIPVSLRGLTQALAALAKEP